ncbi:MAG: hypothetical protein ABSC19_05965 [Syntrophorhabdales bacterium]|jgi:hypothetical protein
MFCKRKYVVDPGNREHVKRMSAIILRKKYQFVVGEGHDVLKGWCRDARIDDNAFLVLTEVILDMGKSGKQREYQEHSELRFFNTPFAAFLNEGETGGKGAERTEVEEE